MKRYAFLLLTCILLFASFTKPHYKKLCGMQFARINDTLYAAVFEVTNGEYKQFLSEINTTQQKLCRIDSDAWNYKFSNAYNVPMAKNYHIHAAFNRYPVVNVSHYAAYWFCEWLNGKYTLLEKNKKVVFRLPTEAEWIASTDYNTATGLPQSLGNGQAENGWQWQNTWSFAQDTCRAVLDGGFYTVRVDAYKPNAYGLYNVVGNVAEMLDKDSIQKGCSWQDTLPDCSVLNSQHYIVPDPRVGFRVFAVVKH
ncbi:MAG: SUMF1/EgtB/PvdO family nonheme iron enzyme [Chitinophagales bacterium]